MLQMLTVAIVVSAVILNVLLSCVQRNAFVFLIAIRTIPLFNDNAFLYIVFKLYSWFVKMAKLYVDFVVLDAYWMHSLA